MNAVAAAALHRRHYSSSSSAPLSSSESSPLAASGDGRGAQQLFVERGVIFARIDSKLQATHPVCCILSSLGPDSLCMYTIVVLCGGTSSPPVSFTCVINVIAVRCEQGWKCVGQVW